MKVYRTVKQTKFVRDGWTGLLTLHDRGTIAISLEHRALFEGISSVDVNGYLTILKPKVKEHKIIFDRLFDLQTIDCLSCGDEIPFNGPREMLLSLCPKAVN